MRLMSRLSLANSSSTSDIGIRRLRSPASISRAVRRIALHHTPFANAGCATIRLKLLKIGALVRVSVRRIKIAMASGYPTAELWGRAAIRLNAAASARGSPA